MKILVSKGSWRRIIIENQDELFEFPALRSNLRPAIQWVLLFFWKFFFFIASEHSAFHRAIVYVLVINSLPLSFKCTFLCLVILELGLKLLTLVSRGRWRNTARGPRLFWFRCFSSSCHMSVTPLVVGSFLVKCPQHRHSGWLPRESCWYSNRLFLLANSDRHLSKHLSNSMSRSYNLSKEIRIPALRKKDLFKLVSSFGTLFQP